MRRKRVWLWLFCFVVAAAAVGFQYYLKSGKKGFGLDRLSALIAKPSDYQKHSGVGYEDPNMRDEDFDRDTRSKKEREAELRARADWERIKHLKNFLKDRKRQPACQTVEYVGSGPKHKDPSTEIMSGTVAMFRQVKQDLMSWLKTRESRIPEATAKEMRKTMESLSLVTPPHETGMDLNWRGIGIWEKDSDGPVIRIGGGFYELFQRDQKRAKFELTRLAAQTWAPCELAGQKIDSPWAALMSCLGYEGTMGCGKNEISDAGWALSSAVAAVLAPIECDLPAFAEDRMAACLFETPLRIGARDLERSLEVAKR